MVEHLERVGKGNQYWKFPKKDDICEVDIEQINGIEPDTDWDYSNSRSHKLILKNHKDIERNVRTEYLILTTTDYNIHSTHDMYLILYAFGINTRVGASSCLVLYM